MPAGVFGHFGVSGNEIADELARKGFARDYVGPEPILGAPRQNGRQTVGSWLCGKVLRTQRQARALTPVPSLPANTRMSSCNRMQSWVVTGLQLAITPWEDISTQGDWMTDRNAGRRKKSSSCMWKCEVLATLRYSYLWFFDPENISFLWLGDIWIFMKRTGLHDS